jgi:hypothetical protein
VCKEDEEGGTKDDTVKLWMVRLVKKMTRTENGKKKDNKDRKGGMDGGGDKNGDNDRKGGKDERQVR